MIVSGMGATREVNQSVVSLQERIMAAQQTIQNSRDALNAQQDILVKATGEVKAKTDELSNTQKQLDKARTEYEELSKTMKAVQQKR